MKRKRCPPIRYSQDELKWLEANHTMVISDYHTAFVAEFGRSDVAAAHLHYLRKRRKWKAGREPGRFAGRHRLFSKAEIAWLRKNCTRELNDYHTAFCAEFSRADVTPAQLFSLRKNQGWRTGRNTRFDKGHVPWTKGRKLPFNPNSARTQFKKGQQPQNTKYAGHERPHPNGYMYISVEEINPHTGFERRYVLKHRWLWERAHGPIPEGMTLKCRGDKANADPSNWELVPRGVLPRLNGRSGRAYDQAPDELKPTIMAVAKLEHRVREKKHSEGKAK